MTPNHGDAEYHQQTSSWKFPTIELCSEEPGTGKTQLLYLIIALTILPETYGDIDLGGRNSAIVMLDTEGRFDIQRLAEVMKGYIFSKDALLQNVDELVHRSLQHLHLYQPQIFSSLITTLSSLQSYLFTVAERVNNVPLTQPIE